MDHPYTDWTTRPALSWKEAIAIFVCFVLFSIAWLWVLGWTRLRG